MNDKINAVAPKITSTGASTVVDEVNQAFVGVADGVIFQVFNQLGEKMRADRPTIQDLINLIFRLDALAPTMGQAVEVAARDVNTAQTVVGEAEDQLPVVSRIAEDGANFSASLIPFLQQTQQAARTAGPAIRQSLILLSQAMLATDQFANVVQSSPVSSSLASTVANRTLTQVQAADDAAQRLTTLLSQMSTLGGGRLAGVVAQQTGIQRNLDTQTALLRQAVSAAQNGQNLSPLAKQLHDLAQTGGSAINQLLSQYDSVIVPGVQNAFTVATSDIQAAHRLFVKTEEMMPAIRQVLRDASAGLAVTAETLRTAEAQLPTAVRQIHDLAQTIRALQHKGNLDELIQLLTIPAGSEQSFFTQPVRLQQNVLYPIPNYGSAMSPFFTTLSLWVGALLLVSLLNVEVDEVTERTGNRRVKDLLPQSYQIYFGRYLIFVTVACLQALCVTLGDVFLLQTYVVDRTWFVLFGVCESVVFMLMVYTLVSVFGNVGKALAIVLLVLQLAASGGTFPIQVTPKFFQEIHPYLPFTYGISLMREAVGGALWDVVQSDLWHLAGYVGVTLVFGLLLKPHINRLTSGMARKARESRLIH